MSGRAPFYLGVLGHYYAQEWRCRQGARRSSRSSRASPARVRAAALPSHTSMRARTTSTGRSRWQAKAYDDGASPLLLLRAIDRQHAGRPSAFRRVETTSGLNRNPRNASCSWSSRLCHRSGRLDQSTRCLSRSDRLPQAKVRELLLSPRFRASSPLSHVADRLAEAPTTPMASVGTSDGGLCSAQEQPQPRESSIRNDRFSVVLSGTHGAGSPDGSIPPAASSPLKGRADPGRQSGGTGGSSVSQSRRR